MTENKRCNKCYGHGSYMTREGATSADRRPCDICNGTGVLPEGYVGAKQFRRATNRRRYYKWDAIDHVHEVKGE